VSRTPRDKWLAHLRKTMVSGETATERTEAMRLYSAATSGMPDGSIPLPELRETPNPPAKQPSEFDEAIAFMMREHPDGGLGCLLDVLSEPRWMAGCWANNTWGWYDVRHREPLLFKDGWVLVAKRIEELGLNADKVYAYPKSHSTLADYTAFIHADFQTQMERFRG
jgi:hypothetical protein